MWIIKTKTLYKYCQKGKYQQAAASIDKWIKTVEKVKWKNSHQLKVKFGNASIISAKRVVFNIKGNEFRLVVDIEYKWNMVFIIWFGSHKEYDKIDVTSLKYEDKAHKN